MDELMAVCREFDTYAGPAGEEDAWPGDVPIAVPRRLFVNLRGVLRSLTAYNESGVYRCIICRDEPMPGPGMTCPHCQAVRTPTRDSAPWLRSEV